MKDITREWLHKSEKDFKVAKKLLKSDDPDSYDLICFLAQQAIEKTMKALLLHHDKAFPQDA